MLVLSANTALLKKVENLRMSTDLNHKDAVHDS